ncbi:hypothetical protein [Tranquillimonas rosea]|uniref:hypothetical protein n=1 Tax=Tranquillimonas rosea TaxID=641238 RepID=UPI003BAA9A21
MADVPNSGWRIKKDRWPNGREFWEVVHPDGFKVVGEKGGVTRYLNRDQAIAARDHMNNKGPKSNGPDLIERS